jgi:hypothetical protein
VTLEDLNAKRSKELEGSTMEAERLKTEHKMRSKSAADAATSLKSQRSMEQSNNSKLMAVLQNDVKAKIKRGLDICVIFFRHKLGQLLRAHAATGRRRCARRILTHKNEDAPGASCALKEDRTRCKRRQPFQLK